MHRTTIVIGIYLVVIGLILTAIGYFTHAPKTVVWDNGLQVSQQVETSKKVADFSKINVSGQDGNVKIVSGYHYNVKVSGDKRQVPQYTVKKILCISINNNRLKLVSLANRPSPSLCQLRKKSLS